MPASTAPSTDPACVYELCPLSSTDTPGTTALAVVLHHACLAELVGLCLLPDDLPLVVHHLAHHAPAFLDQLVPPGLHHGGLLLNQFPSLPTTPSTPPSRSSSLGPPCPSSRTSPYSTTSSTTQPVCRTRYSGYRDLHKDSVCQKTHRHNGAEWVTQNLITFLLTSTGI